MKTGFFIHKLWGPAIAIALLAICTTAEFNHSTSFSKIVGQSATRQASKGITYSNTNSRSVNTSQSAASRFAGSTGTSFSSSNAQQPAGSISSSTTSENVSVGSTMLYPSSNPSASSALVSSSQFLSTAAVSSPPFLHPARMVVGYYGSWAAYSGFTPDKINASNINVLNYAFAKIGTNLQITENDSYIDETNFNKLRTLKSTHPGLRTVISVGGWDDSARFSDAALTESSRAVFADSVVRFIKNYGFDGVDIDWEYPTGGGLASNISRPADRTNFGLLLKTLRSKLDTQGIKDKKHYILSFAGGASSDYASGVGLSNIAKYVDYGMIMTYDLHGSWDTFTDFNAPLYLPSGQSPQQKTSVDGAVRTWLNYGFPANKLVMGVPFYGYVYQGVANASNGLWQHFSSAATVGYDTVQSKYLSSTSYRKFNDSSALVPWLFNGSTFISYDDASSIQRKAQYAVTKNLLGVGAWDISFDKSGVLIKAIKTGLG